jgi:mRNA interferase RelE/StbE
LSYRVVFKKSVARDLRKLGKEEAERVLKKIEQELPEKAASLPLLTGRFSGLRKLRIGDYRVIFTIIDDKVLILRIRHRREVYRNVTG